MGHPIHTAFTMLQMRPQSPNPSPGGLGLCCPRSAGAAEESSKAISLYAVNVCGELVMRSAVDLCSLLC